MPTMAEHVVPSTLNGGWKPHTMRAPILVAFIAVTFVIAGISEFLAQKSQREGGLALSDCSKCLSDIATFGYLYAPTIVSVLYGLVWTWIDLDIRRIQPWLELSRPEGATAESSLLLDYPSSFLAFVPFSAAKRRHWPVFFSGIASMMIFWGTTPLLGAIFGVKSVSVVATVPMAISAILPSLEDQVYKIDTSMLYGTYSVAWLNQSYPAFTTSDYAVIPFAPITSGSHNRTEESWTAITQVLSTDLDCWPASISTTPNDRSYVFDNERGCNTTVAFFQTSPFPDINNVSVVLYIGYHGDAHLDYQLKQPKCSTNTSHQFLAVYAEQTRDALGNIEYKNITGSFCETRYHKQQVSVTVSADTNKPLEGSLSYLGPKQQLSEDEFNSTAFEFLLNTGKPFTTYGNFEFPTPVRDFAACTTLEPFGALSKKDVAWPVTNMVNTALGLSDKPVKQWRDSSILENSFRTAHKAAFAVAVSNLLTPVQVSNGENVSVKRTMYGVVVNRTIAFVFEGLLFVVAFLIAAVWYTSARAESNLCGDPATIGFILRALQKSRSLLGRFTMEDCTGAPELRKSLLKERFSLGLDNTQSVLDINSSFLRPSTPDSELKNEPSTNRRRDIKYAATQPRDLHPATGLIVISVILAALAILAYLKRQEQALNGLSRPTENFTILQILENYIPTVFSTLLEPFLVLLTRILCVLQPFNELRKGRRGPENTLEARYTSLPPQLILWRALNSQHFLLGSLCTITLLANVVTVSLGGMFNEAPVAVEYPLRFTETQRGSLARDTIMDPVYTEHITSGHTYDHFYATWSNLSTNTTLPPWTTHKHAFLPVVMTQDTEKEGTFRTQLRGFGVDSKCTPLSSVRSASESYANLTSIRGGRGTPSYLFHRENGSWTECFPQMSMTGPDPAGRSAREFASALQPDPLGPWSVPPSDKSGFCEDKIALGWLRINSNDSSEIVQSTFMTCEATLKTAMFNVMFDHTGRILNSTQAGNFDDIELFMTRNHSQTLVREANGIITNVGRIGPSLYPLGWHNTSITTDWFNYLLKFYLNSTDLVDPKKDAPDVEALIPVVQDLYQRLFAVLLGQNLPMFKSVDTAEGAVIVGVKLGTETRIFLENNAFTISVVILALNVVVLTAVYWRRKKSYLPRFPSTIGSLIGYVAASRAVRQYGEDYDVKTSISQKVASFKSFSQPTYSFGRYIGVDGNLHLGIEMDPFVVTIDETMRDERKRWYKRRRCGE